MPYLRDYIGNMVAKTSVQVFSQSQEPSSGSITSRVREARRGDLLVVINPDPSKQRSLKRKLRWRDLRNLEYARDVTLRYAKLVQEDFISQLTYDQYVSNMVALEAQLGQ